jgi:hypothetical protein
VAPDGSITMEPRGRWSLRDFRSLRQRAERREH